MKIGIVGAGAIGLWLAGRLANAGSTISVLARGQTLKTLIQSGVTVITADGTHSAGVSASDRPADFEHQDLVIFAVKGQDLPNAAEAAQAMIGPSTLLLPAMNGVPWWFLKSAEGNLAAQPLRSVDPKGKCEKALPTERVIGGVVHASCLEKPNNATDTPDKEVFEGLMVKAGQWGERQEEFKNGLKTFGFEEEVMTRENLEKCWSFDRGKYLEEQKDSPKRALERHSMFEKKYELAKVAQGANSFRELDKQATEAGVDNEMLAYTSFFPLTNDFLDGLGPGAEFMVSAAASLRLENLEEIAERIGKRDSKTGATPQLIQFIRNLSLSDGFRVTDGALLRKAYPAMLRIAISSGGQKAGENLKDILIAMEYMKPEETGRDKEGMFSRFMGTGRKQRRQAADDIYAGIEAMADEDD